MIPTKLFLRLTISIGFLSAVADRLGLWPKSSSAWGNWESFLEYTQIINPILPEALINPIGVLATGTEMVFGLFLLVGFKTELVAKLSGLLLLIFALAMMTSIGIKSVLDYSVLSAAAASFALSTMNHKYFELDSALKRTT